MTSNPTPSATEYVLVPREPIEEMADAFYRSKKVMVWSEFEWNEFVRDYKAMLAAAPKPAPGEWITSVLRDVAELPDRTSPEDFPEAMLVTADELRAIIARHTPPASPIGDRNFITLSKSDYEAFLAALDRGHEADEKLKELLQNPSVCEPASPASGATVVPDGWQPIETAPKEQDVLLYNELWDDTFGETQIGQIDHGGEWNFQSEMNLKIEDDADFQPTHWRPLPAPPASPASLLPEGDERPHKIMLPEEYAALNLKGWHHVCKNVDGFGNVGVRYSAPLPEGNEDAVRKVDEDWQTIESAPQDGSELLLKWPFNNGVRAFWCYDLKAWVLTYPLHMETVPHPTHWRRTKYQSSRATLQASKGE